MAKTRNTLVIYDIATPKRLRLVERVVAGYGHRIQLSVFVCSLSETAKLKLKHELDEIINKNDDQCCMIDLGEGDDILDTFTVIGRALVKIPKLTFI